MLRYVLVLAAVGIFVVLVCWKDKITVCPREQGAARTSDYVQLPTYYDVKTTPTMVGKINPSRKYAVLSTTSAGNAQSLGFMFLLPLTVLAWKRIGFDSIVLVVGSENYWLSYSLPNLVLTSLRRFDAVVIFLDAHPTNAVMVSQVKS